MTTRLIDLDVHFHESLSTLSEYFDEPWRTRLQEGGTYAEFGFGPGGGSGDRGVGGRVKREQDGERGDVVDTSYPNAGMTPEEIPDGMEYLGVDQCLVLSHKLLGAGSYVADDERLGQLAKGSAEYMLDHVLDPSAGIYSALPVPYSDVDASLDLIERLGTEEAFRGIYMVTGGAEPPLGNRKYEPIYELAEEMGLPVVFHTGGSGLDSYHTKGYSKFIETHTLGFLESNMSQLTSLLIQGIPEKFPDLKMVFLESGVFWVGALGQRLDTEYLKRQSEAPLLEQRPSDYIRDRFYFGTQPIENPRNPDHMEAAIEMLGGADSLMYASDYPHWDFDRPQSITDLEFLSDAEKERIMWRNAAEVFDL